MAQIIKFLIGLTGKAKTSPIVNNDAMSRLQQRERLIFKDIACQRPAVDQDNGFTLPGILDVQIGSVACFNKRRFLSFR